MASFLLLYSFITFINGQDIFDNNRYKTGCRNTPYLEDKIQDLQEQIGYLNERELALQKDLENKNKLIKELQAQCNQPGTTEMTTAYQETTTQTTSTMEYKDVIGRHFLIVFLMNYNYIPKYTQFILNADIDGWYFLDIPYLGIKENRSLAVGYNNVTLSYTINPASFVKENKGLYLETSADVSIYALNIARLSSDGFYVIPIKDLSTKYTVVTGEPYGSGSDFYSEVSVAATENDTFINFSFNMNGTINYKQQVYGKDSVLTVQMDRYETFQIEHNHDLTGTVVTSNKPVAVVSGNRCGNVLISGCSHLSEMITPVRSLGKRYIIPIFTSGFHKRFVRIVAAYDNTNVNYSTDGLINHTNINSSSFVDKLIDKVSFMFVSSSKPVLASVLVQYSGNRGPFMVVIPDVDRCLSNYTFSVPNDDFTSYISIIIKSTFVSGLRFDGNLVSTSCSISKKAFEDEDYCLMERSVLPGSHNLQHLTNNNFGLFVYGSRQSDGYGYHCGMNFN